MLSRGNRLSGEEIYRRKCGLTQSNFEKPRKIPTQKRSQRTWNIVVKAAALVLTRHGYERTTTNLIANRAGIRVATIYEDFLSKDVLLNEVQSYWNDTCWVDIERMPERDPTLSLKASVHLLFEKWAGICLLYTSPSPRDQRGSRMPSSA